MNILSFDIEEWYCEKEFWGNVPQKIKEFDRYLDEILDLLEERAIKATFFCVGGMAIEFPEVIKRIKVRGHEIGCHSYYHRWLNTMSRDDVIKDTRMAIDAIEQCIGEKVISYRAPAFSIGKNNSWVFNVLYECGIRRDASVFPAARDFGGFAEFGQKRPTMISIGKAQIKEFPICTTSILGKEFAYTGGGYFRFFPLAYVKKQMDRSEYNMIYFHISDLVTEFDGVLSKKDYETYFHEKGSLKNRYIRYFKSNIGIHGAFKKLKSIIEEKDFINLEQADKMINWDGCKTLKL